MVAFHKKKPSAAARRLRFRSIDHRKDSNPIDFLKLIRDQMIFVATFFAVFGLITTDAYYSQFGIKYQFLGLDYSHIIYRGFTLLYADKLFLVIFSSIITAVFVHRISFSIQATQLVIGGEALSYGLLIAALVGGSYFAFAVGARSAVDDMYVSTTTLQALTHFYSNSKDKSDLVNKLIGTWPPRTKESLLLLLHSSSNEIVVFKTPTMSAQNPSIDIHHIRLSDHDQFSHTSP